MEVHLVGSDDITEIDQLHDDIPLCQAQEERSPLQEGLALLQEADPSQSPAVHQLLAPAGPSPLHPLLQGPLQAAASCPSAPAQAQLVTAVLS